MPRKSTLRYYFTIEGELVATVRNGKHNDLKEGSWACYCRTTSRDKARRMFRRWAIKWYDRWEKEYQYQITHKVVWYTHNNI